MQVPPYDVEESKTIEPTEAEAVAIIEAQAIITDTTCIGKVNILTPAYPSYEAKQRMLALVKGVTQ
jgi:hypothetical protein